MTQILWPHSRLFSCHAACQRCCPQLQKITLTVVSSFRHIFMIGHSHHGKVRFVKTDTVQINMVAIPISILSSSKVPQWCPPLMVPLLLAFFLMVLPLAHPQVASSSVPCERRLRPSVSRLNCDRKLWNYGYMAMMKPIYVDYLVLSTYTNLFSISVLQYC